MNTHPSLGRGVAIVACAASLAGTAIALAPTPALARTASKCANKSVAVKPGGDPTAHIPVKAVTVEGGISCAESYKVISGVLAGKAPTGWKSVVTHFEAPEGLLPQEVKKGGQEIRYAIRGE